MDLLVTIILFLVLLCSASTGIVLQRRLHERHRSRDTVETVRLLMGMLVTFSALVLGLLVSSAKARFDDYSNDLSAYAASLIELDHRLRVYGPDADAIRADLRRYAAAVIADTWPTEAEPSGDYPRFRHGPGARGIEGSQLGDLLAAVDLRIEQLAPVDPFHQQVASRLRERAAQTIQQRWRLIFSAGSTMSWPFLLILAAWLSIIFVIFGLTAPGNGLVYTVIVMSALSIASPLYLILDYSGTRSGLLSLSSATMRTALSHMDRRDVDRGN